MNCKTAAARRAAAAVLLILLSVLAFLSCASESNSTLGETALISKAAFVYDIENDILTVSSAEDERIYPASTTKLLGALLALRILPPDTEISPGEEVYMTGEGASSAYVRPGHTLTVEMLIEAMIIPSGNDAAYALAAACGRELLGDSEADIQKSVSRFTEEMNSFADELGCKNTHFTTPDGLAGEDHFSTLADMAKIAAAAAENELIMKYAAMPCDDVVYASGHTNHWDNTNKQLERGSVYYNGNIVGMKTGSLDGYYCLISLYDDGDGRYIIGTFGSPSDSGRYRDTEKIIKQIEKTAAYGSETVSTPLSLEGQSDILHTAAIYYC